MKNAIKGIILDWAGTTIDFGSFAPVAAFMQAFEVFGITPTMEEIRTPMGMQKRAHIERMLDNERLGKAWIKKYNRPHTQEDIDKIYEEFKPALIASLKEYTTPILGVLSAVQVIRNMRIKIGSTTGYTNEMMEIVVPAALEKGYSPDCLVCPDEVGGVGRPYPYMLWRALEKLNIASINEVVKIGDTIADIEEGKNAGCVTVGVIKGSNMLGLSEDEWNHLSAIEATAYYEMTKKQYIKAGADYVIASISDLPMLIEQINKERGK